MNIRMKLMGVLLLAAMGLVADQGPVYRRVLFSGNSITRHGVAPQIGWTNCWGMAASAEAKDYVHLVVDGLAARTGTRPEFTVHKLPLEWNYSDMGAVTDAATQAAAWKPDLVVIALGENAHAVTNDAEEAVCRAAYLKTVQILQAGGAKVLLRTPFWRNPRHDRLLGRVADATGALYLDNGDLGGKKEMRADGLFAHAGVAAHPGDAGMAEIARRIVDVACAPYERKAGDVVFKGVQIHGVADLEPGADGLYSFRRAGKGVHLAMPNQGQAMNAGSTGVEFRFVMKGDSVKLRLGTPADDAFTRLTVYHGDIIGDWPELNKSVLGRDCEITIKNLGAREDLRSEAKAQGHRFDPSVVRLVLPWGRVGIRDVVGEVAPPPPELCPKRTYLAYGSSITHGSNALAMETCYASLVGAGLGADVRNLGFAGAARMEPEMAEFIAGLPFDYATLEMGINVLGMAPAEFETRVRYFVRRVAESHPQAKILAIDVFGNRLGAKGREQAAAFRAIVKRVVGELALPNVTYVDGLGLLADGQDMSVGGAHPAPAGHARIAQGILARLRGDVLK